MSGNITIAGKHGRNHPKFSVAAAWMLLGQSLLFTIVGSPFVVAIVTGRASIHGRIEAAAILLGGAPLFLIGVSGIAAACGLSSYKGWARALTVVVCVFSLLDIVYLVLVWWAITLSFFSAILIAGPLALLSAVILTIVLRSS